MISKKVRQLAIFFIALTGLSACGLKDDLVLPAAAKPDQATMSEVSEVSEELNTSDVPKEPKENKKQDKNRAQP